MSLIRAKRRRPFLIILIVASVALIIFGLIFSLLSPFSPTFLFLGIPILVLGLITLATMAIFSFLSRRRLRTRLTPSSLIQTRAVQKPPPLEDPQNAIMFRFITIDSEHRDLIFLRDMKNIRLAGLRIHRIDLASLRHFSELEELSLADNHIETVNLIPLHLTQKLVGLNLGKNNLAQIDLSPLQHHSKLEWIDLTQNQLDKVDVTPLFTCPKLQVLELDTDVGVTANTRFRKTKKPPEALKKILQQIKWVKADEVLTFWSKRLKQVLELFELLRLEHLAELLHFPDTGSLGTWLRGLPGSLPLRVQGMEVLIPSSLWPEEIHKYIMTSTLTTPPPPARRPRIRPRPPDQTRLRTGVSVTFKPQMRQGDQHILEWMKDSMTAYGEGRWRHAAIDGWTVIEALLSVLSENYLGEPKPLHLSTAQLLRQLTPHMANNRPLLRALQNTHPIRDRIYPGSPDPHPTEAEQIQLIAQQFCQYLEIPLDRLTAPGVQIPQITTRQTCPVCKKVMRAGQRIISTPCCNAHCHYEHLVQRVQSMGRCPSCNQALIIRQGQITTL